MLTFDIPNVPADKFPVLESKLQANGFSEAIQNSNPQDLLIQGDSCTVEAVYNTLTLTLTITVKKHPWIVSDSFVQSKITQAIQTALNAPTGS